MYDEVLIGFDAREMWLESGVRTAHENWEDVFLLRKQIDKVLSTDELVWPSVFDLDDALQPPDWRGMRQFLWDNLQRMEEHLVKGWNSAWKPCWIIAITELLGSQWKHDMVEVGFPVVPPDLDINWTRLGYDISDEFLLSGLSDCGYTTEEIRILGERFRPHLNQYHLFTEAKQAIELQKITDERVREHAPFFVYGLYLIRRVAETSASENR